MRLTQLQFWKQFFEASANVSLSGYEEHPNEDPTQDQTATEDSTSDINQSNLTETASYDTPSSERLGHSRQDDLDLSSLSISSHSTPRPPHHEKSNDDTITSSVAYPSPYGGQKQETSESDVPFELHDSTLPTTPGKSRGYDEMSSPFIPSATRERPSTAKRSQYQKPADPVMHHMLDKTYRVQATPLGKGFEKGGRSKFTTTPKRSKYSLDDSPISSPEPEAPHLNPELFSPVKSVTTPTPRRNRRPSPTHLDRITPKPGISVLTPAKSGGTGKQRAWDSDDDFDDTEDGDLGPSPPKTMQFHIPQSRLMKTPGKFVLFSEARWCYTNSLWYFSQGSFQAHCVGFTGLCGG